MTQTHSEKDRSHPENGVGVTMVPLQLYLKASDSIIQFRSGNHTPFPIGGIPKRPSTSAALTYSRP